LETGPILVSLRCRSSQDQYNFHPSSRHRLLLEHKSLLNKLAHLILSLGKAVIATFSSQSTVVNSSSDGTMCRDLHPSLHRQNRRYIKSLADKQYSMRRTVHCGTPQDRWHNYKHPKMGLALRSPSCNAGIGEIHVLRRWSRYRTCTKASG